LRTSEKLSLFKTPERKAYYCPEIDLLESRTKSKQKLRENKRVTFADQDQVDRGIDASKELEQWKRGFDAKSSWNRGADEERI